MANSPKQTDPYVLPPTFDMALSGGWETGGALEFFEDGQRLEIITLARAPWALMANLFKAAIDSRSTHWLQGFVRTKHLVYRLDRRDVSSHPTPQTVYILVNKIRSQLAACRVHKITRGEPVSGKEWAERLLHRDGARGYRIGVAPSQLQLFIGGVEYPGQDGDTPSL